MATLPIVALQSLAIDHGTITSVERDESQTLVVGENKTLTDLPPRTIVKIALRPAEGSNINVELWLPDVANWNGRLMGLGNGGAAGRIGTGGLADGSRRGYATVTTDMGTAPNSDSGIGNREVWKDFGFRATHLMTVVAKQIITAYYGRPPERAYFAGGSTGGQQAMSLAQRYPDDYDGIVAHIAAHCRTPLHAYFLWNEQILQKCPFDEAQMKSVIAAGNEYMADREVPAIAGKFVSDPRCNAEDIEAVIALAMKKDPTLTQDHAAALRKLFDGPHHSVTGERIFDGIPIGSSWHDARGNLYLFNWVIGKEKNLLEINFGDDIDTYTAALGPYLNAENPDLSAFAERGGKLLMIMGSADACVPYHTSIDYYEQVCDRMGGLEKVQEFFKLYTIPGLGHGGGPGLTQLPDMLEIVRAWREGSAAPDAITARREAGGATEVEMPVYPYPKKTGWDAATRKFIPIEGRRGGVGRVADRFLPPAEQ